MSVVSVRIKTLTAFGDSKIIIIATGLPYIEEVGSAFAGPDAFAVNAFHFFVIIFVRHCIKFKF